MGGRGSASGSSGSAARVAVSGGRRNLIGGRRNAQTPIIRNTRTGGGGQPTTSRGGGISGRTGVSVRGTASTGPIPARNQRKMKQRRRRGGKGR